MKTLRGITWIFLSLTFGLTPLYAVIACVILAASLFWPITIFGLSVEATQIALFFALIILFTISGVVYDPYARWNN